MESFVWSLNVVVAIVVLANCFAIIPILLDDGHAIIESVSALSSISRFAEVIFVVVVVVVAHIGRRRCCILTTATTEAKALFALKHLDIFMIDSAVYFRYCNLIFCDLSI